MAKDDASRLWGHALFAALLIAFALNTWNNVVRHSGVCDELGAHIPAGYLYWKSGAYSGGVDNFPLGQLLIALPVRLLGLDYTLFSEQHLTLFRFPVVASGILLGVLLFVMTHRLLGRCAAYGALSLYAFSPNILAHASLATLDIPLACGVFATAHALHAYADRPSVVRAIRLAVVLGAALVVKVQATLLIPLVGTGLAVVYCRAPVGRARLATSWLLLLVISACIINLVYLHVPLVDGRLLPPLYTSALAAKLQHSEAGHFAYLLGAYSDDGWWYYFPVAIMTKTPLPSLLLIALGLTTLRRLERSAYVLVPIVVFLGAGMASHVNIGIRHVLVIYPFLFMLGGVGIAAGVRRRGWARMAVLSLLGLYVAETVAIGPHHLSYFNQIAGGPEGGHTVLIDSNYDWGQNDRFLDKYLQTVKGPYHINPDPLVPVAGRVIVNANALYGVLGAGAGAYPWLEELEPVGRIAFTWFEYDVAPAMPRAATDRLARLRPLQRRVRSQIAYSRAIGDRSSQLGLARTAFRVAEYDAGFDILRQILTEQPNNQDALALGGEMIVRWKLGVLLFETDRYLHLP